MYAPVKILFAAAALVASSGAFAQIVFYEHDGFQGQSFTAEGEVRNFRRYGFNDAASSVAVLRGRWEVCAAPRFEGPCVVLRPGRYPSLSAMGLNDRVSSVRPIRREARIEERRFAPPPPVTVYDNYRRPNERLFEARVTDVRAVYAQGPQRCWVERERVGSGGGDVGGAIVGGLIGGVLGHQIGSGRGQDAATVGGAVAGAAIGSGVGRDGYTRDVRRCENVPTSGRPDHWDVTYEFRGRMHHMQTTVPPGPTVTVNERGEPRG